MQRSPLASLSRMPVREDLALRIIVVDNDAAGSAPSSVEAFARQSGIPVPYVLEPQKDVSRARNRSIRKTFFYGGNAHTTEVLWRSADDQVSMRELVRGDKDVRKWA